MDQIISEKILTFFQRIPRLRPSKDGNLVLKIADTWFILSSKNKTIRIEKKESVASLNELILVSSLETFEMLFSATTIEEYYQNLLNAVLVNRDLKLETDETTDPMKNVFFRILSINRGKKGINRYELMIPII